MDALGLRKIWFSMLTRRMMAVAGVAKASQLARVLKLHPQTVLDWSNGERDPRALDVEQWVKIAEFLSEDYLDLLEQCDRYSGYMPNQRDRTDIEAHWWAGMREAARVMPLDQALHELSGYTKILADRVGSGGHDMRSFAQIISEAIASSGLSDQEAARHLGISLADLESFRSGSRLPSRSELGRMIGSEIVGLTNHYSWEELNRLIDKKNGSPGEAI